jgi:uncharacterized protein
VTVEPVTLDNLDPDVRELYVAPDGRWRLEVAPALDMNEDGSLEQFGTTVRAASPNATGAPVEIAGAARWWPRPCCSPPPRPAGW